MNNNSNSAEKENILNFLKTISQKNYAEANKYLQEVINSKIKDRIEKTSDQKLF